MKKPLLGKNDLKLDNKSLFKKSKKLCILKQIFEFKHFELMLVCQELKLKKTANKILTPENKFLKNNAKELLEIYDNQFSHFFMF